MNPRIFFICFALSFVPALSQAQSTLAKIEAEQQALFDGVAPSVVFVVSSGGFGSGFFVAENLVLTNSHVVRRNGDVKVVVRGGKKYGGEVIARDDDSDLALLEVEANGSPVHLVPTSAVRVGSWVGAVGHGEGGVWTFTSGMVSNVYVQPGKAALIQTQIPINLGNSGGPILTRTGDVVGVATAKNARAENLNFAVPVETAVKKFPALRKSCECLRVSAPAKAKVFVDGRLVGTGPEVVIPATRGEHEVLVVHGSDSRQRKIDFPAQKALELK